MNRDEKATAIEEIAAQIEGAEAIFAVDYRGISVPQAAELRSKLRDADASFRVVKNRLTKIAADKAGEERLAELLEGPTALTFVRGDTAHGGEGDLDLQQRARGPHLQGRLHGRPQPRRGQVQVDRPPAFPRRARTASSPASSPAR